MRLKVLHFDDNAYELESFAKNLQKESIGPEFAVVSCATPHELLETLRADPQVDIIVLDVYMQELNERVGPDLAQQARVLAPHAAIMMRSSFTDARTVARCLASGADDYIAKTAEKGELSLRLRSCLELVQHKRGSGHAVSPTGATNVFAGPTMAAIAERVPRIINSAVMAVHIEGEPGTGKEVVGELFRQALGTSIPFVKLNCGAISPSLLESELFGHVRGAFTGAAGDHKGLIEEANGGWIFLDEIATLPTSAQIALLRVIENQEVKPLGSAKTKKVKVRVISATNENLEDLVRKGTFRKDLWQRLIETSLELKPLRARPAEIATLIEHFCKTMPGGPYTITAPAKALLTSYTWEEGNVRELRNCLRAMTEFALDKTLAPVAIPARILSKLDTGEDGEMRLASDQTSASPLNFSIMWDPKVGLDFEEACDRLLVHLIFTAHASHHRLSVRGLAKLLNLPKTSLGDRLRKLIQKSVLSKDDASRMLGLDY